MFKPRKNSHFLEMWALLAGHITCSAELSMKKFYDLGASFKFDVYVDCSQWSFFLESMDTLGD